MDAVYIACGLPLLLLVVLVIACDWLDYHDSEAARRRRHR
jgi:hypothetical protein